MTDIIRTDHRRGQIPEWIVEGHVWCQSMAVASLGNAGRLPNEDVFPCLRIRERKLVGSNSYYRAITLVEILNVVDKFASGKEVELRNYAGSIVNWAGKLTKGMKEKIVEEERDYVHE